MHARFYAPDLAAPGDLVALPPDESRHLVRVLRLHAGDRVIVFDGRGRQVEARVETIGRTVAVRVGQPVPAIPEPAVAVALAQAVLKGDAMDQVVRDATMMGVAAIQPIVPERSEVPLAVLERGRRAERWARIAVSSAKQCGRATVPPVVSPVALPALLARNASAHGLLLVEPQAGGSIERPASLAGRPDRTTLLVGPEGGWAAGEIEAAMRAGFRPLTLGPRTLRADVAALVALSTLRFAWGDL